MADERKVFPVETVLALIFGKGGDNAKNLASFLTGYTALSTDEEKTVGPFAASWLCRWYPKFMTHEWHEGQSWDAFVTKVKGLVGDNVSVSPMEGRMKELVGQVIETVEENAKSLAKQTEAVLLLEKEVKDLRPVREQARELQKKVDDLESKAKSMKTEMNGLNRKLSEFEGKVAIDHEDLMQNIKDAIKDGLKGLSIGHAVANTIEAASDSSADAVVESEVEDDFGFGSNSSKDSDGFGF